MPVRQNKLSEIEFFDRHADSDEYDVFTAESSGRLVAAFKRMTSLPPGSRIADLGCGSGTFSVLLQAAGYSVIGIDISPKLIALGRSEHPGLELIEGDIEHLPWSADSVDGALLSGVVHHLPDPSRCASEVYRILRSGGRFMAFDPNRRNPFMWLYRDHASPFYSSVGVTENERPVLASQVAEVFRRAGFSVTTDFIAGLSYRYVASATARRFLPVYNLIDMTIFNLPFMRQVMPFVLTAGVKP